MTIRCWVFIYAVFLFAAVAAAGSPQGPSGPSSGSAQDTPAASDLPLRPDMPCSAVVEDEIPYQGKLTPAQERRARRVYRRSIVITAHDHCFHSRDFADQKRGGVTVRTLKLTTDGVWWHDGKRGPIESEIRGWEKRGQMAIDILNEEIKASHGSIVPIRSVDDIIRAKKQGKQGVILSFEGGRPLEGKLTNLKKFYDEGLRDMQLFWAVPSPLKARDNTLTPFGGDVIREMNRLGLVVDLSHMTDAAFHQALAITAKPIIVSHCGVAGVQGLKGGGTKGGTDQLNDDGLKAIAANGGAICLHFYGGYIRPNHGTRSSVEDLVDHMDYVKRLVGIDYVALGTDYFPERGTRWIDGASSTRGMPNVAREMVRRGYTDEEIAKVLGRNLMRIYRQVWSTP